MLTVLNRHHGNPKGQYIGRGTPGNKAMRAVGHDMQRERRLG